MRKSPEELYKERFRRVKCAVDLKEPYRVPGVGLLTFFEAKSENMKAIVEALMKYGQY